ncbi:MAG: hypothetical protein KAS94_14020 [Desulfobulbaceae bacterium]|nr:hypothetical protein [Desulfobulbaceae bacterium]
MMNKKEKTLAQQERDKRQLGRLQTLIDVVFGLMIIRLFALLPHLTNPESGNLIPWLFLLKPGRTL